MPPILIQTLRSRWFAVVVHLAFWLLLYLAVSHLGGKAPAYRDAGSPSGPPRPVTPAEKLETVFTATSPGPATNSTGVNPFFTRHFIPPPTPAPPPPPTTRKIDVTYQGFYQTTNGPKFAVLKVAEGIMVAKIGALVATNVYVAEASLTNVILTNLTARTNILPLNTKTEIEVPIR
jgi:hypothetical protein